MANEHGRLNGKVAIISGGARGMGEAEARMFVDEGGKVAVCDVRDELGETLVRDIGDNAFYQHLDVTREGDWAAAVVATTKAFGKVNVLVNNAGIADGAMLGEMTLESYRRVIDVNQTGVFLGMTAVVEPMTAAGGGSILNVSSIDGMVGMNGVMGYVASKWAVRGMTKAAAMELGPRNIRVNSIHPGFIRTDLGTPEGMEPSFIHEMIDRHTERLAPLARAGRPEEIARLAVFLASDESSYSTGSEFVADGGLIAGYPAPGGQ